MEAEYLVVSPLPLEDLCVTGCDNCSPFDPRLASPTPEGKALRSALFAARSKARAQKTQQDTVCATPAEGGKVDDKGKNLAGDGLKRGEQVQVTLTGGFIGTDAEALFTLEYVTGSQTYSHSTMHVEDFLFGKVIYLVAADGVSGATALSFSDSNLQGQPSRTHVSYGPVPDCQNRDRQKPTPAHLRESVFYHANPTHGPIPMLLESLTR